MKWFKKISCFLSMHDLKLIEIFFDRTRKVKCIHCDKCFHSDIFGMKSQVWNKQLESFYNYQAPKNNEDEVKWI